MRRNNSAVVIVAVLVLACLAPRLYGLSEPNDAEIQSARETMLSLQQTSCGLSGLQRC